MVKPHDLYFNTPVISESKEIWEFCLEKTFPDFNLYDNCCNYNKNEKVTIKTIAYHHFDERRIYKIQTLWIDDIPFGILERAGREGDDHFKLYVTDKSGYIQAGWYFVALTIVECNDDFEQISEDEDNSDIGNFYSHTLTDFIDPEFKPKYKVGDVVTIETSAKHWLSYSSEKMNAVVKITDVRNQKISTYSGILVDYVLGDNIGDKFVFKQGCGNVNVRFDEKSVIDI